MKLSDLSKILFALIIAGLFWYFIFKSFPIGIVLVMIGACLATIQLYSTDKLSFYISSIGSWLCPIGIIYTFFINGWLWGLFSIVISLITYHYAKVSE